MKEELATLKEELSDLNQRKRYFSVPLIDKSSCIEKEEKNIIILGVMKTDQA